MTIPDADSAAALSASEELLERLQPQPIDEITARRLARSAIAAAGARRRRTRGQRVVAATFAAAAAALLWFLHAEGVVTIGPSASRAPQPLAVSPQRTPPQRLASGDVMTTATGARVRVQANTQAKREIRVDSGDVLFEVDPLEPGEIFAVTSPHLSARVRGTVFSIEVDAAHTIVRVYDGIVLVQAQQPVELRSQQSFDSSTGTDAAVASGPFDDLACAAATARPAQKGRTTKPAVATDAGSATQPAPQSQPRSPVSLPNPALARRWIADGELERALRASRQALDAGASPETWLLIQADALRGLKRTAQAASAYESLVAAAARKSELAIQAGYMAASLRLQLNENERALAVLATSGATDIGAALEERALILRVQALERLARHTEAQQTARRYLERFPSAGHAGEMRRIVDLK